MTQFVESPYAIRLFWGDNRHRHINGKQKALSEFRVTLNEKKNLILSGDKRQC